jgi:hypothetical protein
MYISRQSWTSEKVQTLSSKDSRRRITMIRQSV